MKQAETNEIVKQNISKITDITNLSMETNGFEEESIFETLEDIIKSPERIESSVFEDPNMSESVRKLIEFINDKFDGVINSESPSTIQRARSSCYQFFYSSKEQILHQPLLVEEKNISKKQIAKLYVGGMILATLAAGYASWMYHDSSAEAAEEANAALNQTITYAQAHSSMSLDWLYYITSGFSWLIKECAVPTFALFSMKIMKSTIEAINYLFSSKKDPEMYLVGQLNPLHGFLSALIGASAELPLLKVANDATKSRSEKVNNLLSGVTELPTYITGGSEFTERLNNVTCKSRFLSKTWDETAKKYNKIDKNRFDKMRKQITANVSQVVTEIFQEYATQLTLKQQFNSENLNNIIKTLSALKYESKVENLKNFIDILQGNKANNQNQPVDIEKTCDFCETIINIMKNSIKGTAFFALAIFSLAMLINDAAAAFYAGYDLIKNDGTAKRIAGIITGLCTGIAGTGIAIFGLEEIGDFIKGENPDPLKFTQPKSFYALSGIIFLIGLFSGGPTGLEGNVYIARALKDLGLDRLKDSLPKFFAGFGFLGAGLTDTPYCLSFASDLLQTIAMQTGDETIKKLMGLLNGTMCLNATILNMKMECFYDLVTNSVFEEIINIPQQIIIN